MIGSNIDEANVACEIVDSVRIGARNFGVGKVMPLNFDWLLGGKPLLPSIVVVADEFLFLGVHRNDGETLFERLLHRCVDVPKLCIAVWVV